MKRTQKLSATREKVAQLPKLGTCKKKVFHAYVRFLEGKRFSKSTVAVYSSFIAEFLRFTKKQRTTAF